MCNIEQCHEMLVCLLPLFIFLIIWDIVWKTIGLWKSARNNHLVWFLCIAFINTCGILPIIYILKDKKKKKAASEVQ